MLVCARKSGNNLDDTSLRAACHIPFGSAPQLPIEPTVAGRGCKYSNRKLTVSSQRENGFPGHLFKTQGKFALSQSLFGPEISIILTCKEKVSFQMTDDRDFIERSESLTEKLYGRSATIDQIADNFALYGVKKRADALENLDAELRTDISSGSHSLRRRAQLLTLRKKMSQVHQALRRARR